MWHGALPGSRLWPRRRGTNRIDPGASERTLGSPAHAAAGEAIAHRFGRFRNMIHIEADVAIVGGGLIGCATAYYLRKRGRSVVLLERGFVGAQSSGVN